MGNFPGGGSIDGIEAKVASDVTIGGGGGTGQKEDPLVLVPPEDEGTSRTGNISSEAVG